MELRDVPGRGTVTFAVSDIPAGSAFLSTWESMYVLERPELGRYCEICFRPTSALAGDFAGRHGSDGQHAGPPRNAAPSGVDGSGHICATCGLFWICASCLSAEMPRARSFVSPSTKKRWRVKGSPVWCARHEIVARQHRESGECRFLVKRGGSNYDGNHGLDYLIRYCLRVAWCYHDHLCLHQFACRKERSLAAALLRLCPSRKGRSGATDDGEAPAAAAAADSHSHCHMADTLLKFQLACTNTEEVLRRSDGGLWTTYSAIAEVALQQLPAQDLVRSLPTDYLTCMMLRLHFNEHGIVDRLRCKSIGRGLYPYGVFLNHSCLPNAVFVHSSDGTLVYRVVRDVKAHEEITISYTFLGRPREERRSYLDKRYFFLCCCQRCTDPPGEDLAGEETLQLPALAKENGDVWLLRPYSTAATLLAAYASSTDGAALRANGVALGLVLRKLHLPALSVAVLRCFCEALRTFLFHELHIMDFLALSTFQAMTCVDGILSRNRQTANGHVGLASELDFLDARVRSESQDRAGALAGSGSSGLCCRDTVEAFATKYLDGEREFVDTAARNLAFYLGPEHFAVARLHELRSTHYTASLSVPAALSSASCHLLPSLERDEMNRSVETTSSDNSL